MTVIAIPNSEKHLIRQAKAGKRPAQRQLYERYSPKMLGVCRQYIRDLHFAEDVMVSAFVRVFKNLSQFQDKGSFEGWIRKIMVNECISYLRKQQFVVFDDEVVDAHSTDLSVTETQYDADYLQSLIDELPEGYRMVFLLYAVEGYKHPEIAETLGISEGTSKSQLFKARKVLQENLRLNVKHKTRNGRN